MSHTVTVGGKTVSIVHPNSGIVLPPIFAELNKLTASDIAAGDFFGHSVAIDGTTMVIGAEREDGGPSDPIFFAGAAYVFEESGGVWSEVKKLTASDAGASFRFGYSVAISGSTIVVGARGGNSNAGAAYVFEKGGSWPSTETAKLIASDATATDNFGWSVGISGTTVAVGTPQQDTNGISAGSVYIFEKGGTWPTTQTQKIQSSDIAAGDSFGYSVGVSGTAIVIGAWKEDTGANAAGAAYVFEKSGTWLQVQKLQAFAPVAIDQFGNSVAISGSNIVVGAMLEDTGGVDAGAAYVFEKSGTWPATETAKITASDTQAGDHFGISVAISGTTLVIGTADEDGGSGDPLSAAGAAYVFEKNGTWSETVKLIAGDAQANDQFGWSVGVSGTTVNVGARLEDGGAGDPLSAAGAAYVFKK